MKTKKIELNPRMFSVLFSFPYISPDFIGLLSELLEVFCLHTCVFNLQSLEAAELVQKCVSHVNEARNGRFAVTYFTHRS